MTAVRKEEETKEMGKIIGICISEKRGTAKHEVETAKLVEDWGIEGDAHAGHWHRQVSLLSYEKIEAFRAKGADILLGAFGENLIVEGYDFRNLPVGTRFSCRDARSVKNVTAIVPSINAWVNASCRGRAFSRWCCAAARFKRVTPSNW